VDRSDRNRTIIDGPARFPKALALSLGLGLAFGGGLVAGGVADTEVTPPAPEPDDVLARAEARTRAYDALVKNQPLTWHRELTEPDPAMPPPPAAAKVATTTTTTTTAPAPDHATQHAAEPPVEDRVLRAAEPEADAPAGPAATTVRADAAAAADAAATRGAQVDRVDEDGGDIVRPDPKKLDEAFARLAGDAKAASTTNRRYAVQLASVPTMADARATVEKWKKKGIATSIVTAEVAGKGTMYRVRIAGLASKDEAARRKAEANDGIIVAE
jgi:cell division septation protein DedD